MARIKNLRVPLIDAFPKGIRRNGAIKVHKIIIIKCRGKGEGKNSKEDVWKRQSDRNLKEQAKQLRKSPVAMNRKPFCTSS